jgi:hypothetical protein
MLLKAGNYLIDLKNFASLSNNSEENTNTLSL